MASWMPGPVLDALVGEGAGSAPALKVWEDTT